MSMRDVIFRRFWINIYFSIGVFGIYYKLCEIYFKCSDLWNMLIIIPLFIYILRFDFDNFMYKDYFSDIVILKLRFKCWCNKWKKNL